MVLAKFSCRVISHRFFLFSMLKLNQWFLLQAVLCAVVKLKSRFSYENDRAHTLPPRWESVFLPPSYPDNMLRMLNKNIARFLQRHSQEHLNRARKGRFRWQGDTLLIPQKSIALRTKGRTARSLSWFPSQDEDQNCAWPRDWLWYMFREEITRVRCKINQVFYIHIDWK